MLFPLICSALIASLVLTACGGDDQDDVAIPVQGGPLKIEGSGEGLLPAPRTPQTTATFGALFPCTENGSEVTIVDVKFDTTVEPVEVYSALRLIPARADREDPNSRRWLPNLAIYGDPRNPGMAGRLPGEILIPSAGHTLDAECDRGPDTALVELLTVVTADRGGAYVNGQTVTYSADGETFTAQVAWRFGICGTEVRIDRCPGSSAR